jgi:hypothetical protein
MHVAMRKEQTWFLRVCGKQSVKVYQTQAYSFLSPLVVLSTNLSSTNGEPVSW